LTPQGRAIRQASIRFGNGATLPFTPCKRGYIPLVKGRKMYACSLHDAARRKRFQIDGGNNFRKGEMDLTFFWNRDILKESQTFAETGEQKLESKMVLNDRTQSSSDFLLPR
jgi:hypothetical protein